MKTTDTTPTLDDLIFRVAHLSRDLCFNVTFSSSFDVNNSRRGLLIDEVRCHISPPGAPPKGVPRGCWSWSASGSTARQALIAAIALGINSGVLPTRLLDGVKDIPLPGAGVPQLETRGAAQ